MRRCIRCGCINEEGSVFCAQCGGQDFEDAVGAAPVNPVPQMNIPAPKKEVSRFIIFTIFGFTASIVGLFWISLILEPLAFLSTCIGFVKEKRYRGLAIAGFTIAVIGLLIRLFITLYDIGYIPKWLISGVFG
ncbi:MAG: hypothetical protein ACI4J1_06315 [Ruminiclostridium sp.]